MKQIFVSAAFAFAFAVMAVGCASETTEGSGELGSVGVNLLVGDTDVKAVSFKLVCDSGFALNGQFNVNDEQDPPIWAAIMDVPVPNPETGEVCTIALIASDDAGNVLCTGEQSFTVEANETVKVDVVLLCGEEGDDPLGNIDIDATFEIIEGNNCPRLHFLNAVPDEVPAEGSEVTVWVSDKDGDTLTTELTATGGSFVQPNSVLTDTADPVSVLTTYLCDDASGGQTISVTVSDNEPLCDKSTSFDVTCPGVNLCEGVVCDDTCNQCTVGICTNQSAPECEETNVDNGTPCIAGIPGWVTEFCTPPEFSGPCEKTDTMANTGNSSARIFNDIPGTPSVLKQANKGIGKVQPGDTVTVSFWAKGTGENGGVAFAEFFTELEGGGTSNSILLGNAPLSLDPDQFQFFSFPDLPVGDPAGGGVTVQFNAATGAIEGSTSKLFVDDVSITLESGEDVAENGGVEEGTANSTCQEGICEPVVIDLCEGNTCDDEDTECSDSSCDQSTGQCVATPINENGACDDDTGTCTAGVCVPNEVCEYTQDFEGLTLPPPGQTDFPPNSLSLDGWLVGGNEFESDGTFFNSYFAFPAPNGGPAFSAVVADEGDPVVQGSQQMSIYNDYNNANHGDGPPDLDRIIEAVVFRERTIVAADVGTTICFTFDAKAGNIGGASTAEAFIQVLEQVNSTFGVLAFDTLETTNFSTETWANNNTICVLIDGSLNGQLLQYGGRSRASNFEGSGIFYDNMNVCSAPTP